MFVLHIELKPKPGSRQALEKVYVEIFRPAIGVQAGFSGAELLRPNQEGADYVLSLAFDRQESQQKWVATETHQRAWPEIESLCTEFSGKAYRTV